VERNAELVRLDPAIETGLAWEALAVRPGDTAALVRLFEELEFDSLARELREPDLFRK
jgi:hypothetical protein